MFIRERVRPREAAYFMEGLYSGPREAAYFIASASRLRKQRFLISNASHAVVMALSIVSAPLPREAASLLRARHGRVKWPISYREYRVPRK